MKRVPTLLGLVLLLGAGWVVVREFRHIQPHEVARAIGAIPPHALFRAGACTLAAFFVTTFYDRLATRYAGHRLPWRRTAFAAFCAYVLSHNLGFSAVSGGAVRYRLYSAWGLPAASIARVIAFCSLTFVLGSMALGGAVALWDPGAIPLVGADAPHALIRVVGAALWLLVGAYASLSRVLPSIRIGGHTVALPGAGTALKQVVLATADLSITASIVFALLPPAHGLGFLRFLTIYIASYAAGLVASVPGGLGVFDTAILIGLNPFLPAPAVLGAVLVFRLFYYVIPLFVAGASFSGHELYLRGARFGLPRRAGRQAGLLRASEADFSTAVSAGLTALAGVLLLATGVFEPSSNPAWIGRLAPTVAGAAGLYALSLIGAALMVLAIGLAHRVTLAWGASVVLLMLAAVLLALEGQPLWLAGAEAGAALVTLPFRNSYYRHARILAEPLEAGTALPLLALAGSVLAFASLAPEFGYLDGASWWRLLLTGGLPGRLRLTMGLLVLLFVFACWRLIRPGRVGWLAWTDDARRRFAALGATPPDDADGIVLGETGRSCIAFRRERRVLIGLGDPAGAAPDRISAIWRLRDLAVQEGRDTAAWGTGAALVPTWEDLGLTAWPLDNNGDGDRDGAQFACVSADTDLETLRLAVGAEDAGARGR